MTKIFRGYNMLNKKRLNMKNKKEFFTAMRITSDLWDAIKIRATKEKKSMSQVMREILIKDLLEGK